MKLQLPAWIVAACALTACQSSEERVSSARAESVLAAPAGPAARSDAPAEPRELTKPSVAAEPSAPSEPRDQQPIAERTPVAPATQDDVVQRVIELGRGNSRVDEHLRYLCLEIGARLTGSTNAQRACEWTRDQFASMGLEARLEQWGEWPVGFDRGSWRGAIVAPERVELEFNTMAWTAGTNGPKRGRALPFPTDEAELAELSERIAGAWLVRPPAAEFKTAGGEVVFEKPKQPSSGLIEKVQDLIGEKGGLGEVRAARGDLLITDGRRDVKWEELPTLVSIRMGKAAHDDLWARMQKSADVELEFDVDNRFVQGPRPNYNVIADLKGASKPDEYVIVCGHLDSWDGAQGTVDNGTGVATTMEAARLLASAGAKPERTIRFILWTGEEQGLFGSEAYVREHASELPKISAVLNHDGGTNYLSGLRCAAKMEPQLREACAALVDLHPDMPFAVKPAADVMQVSPDSDHWPFFQAGVPGFFWEQAGRSNYTRHHHTQFDTLDAAIPEYQRHSATVAAITAFNIANLPELLDRTNMKAPEQRRLGVRLEGNKIATLMDGRAKAAGMEAGDVLLSINDKEVKTQAGVSNEVQKGEARKVIKVQRGEQQLEFVLDWSDDPDEPRRVEMARLRAEREAKKKAEEAAKEAARQESEPASASSEAKDGTADKP